MNPEALPLRDIHLPPEPGFWPLAPGWWILLGLLLCLSVLAAWVAWRRQRRIDVRFSRALAALRDDWKRTHDHRVFLTACADLLRRAAIGFSGRQAVAGLVGEDWRRHLNSATDDQPFDRAPAQHLIDAHYRPAAPVLSEAVVDELTAICERWARGARRRGPAA